MANDININESAILEMLNEKIDYDGGNYKGSGLAKHVVDVTGDTMTGNLNFKKSTNSYPTVSGSLHNGILGDLPDTTQQGMRIITNDKGSTVQWIATIQHLLEAADGRSRIYMGVRNTADKATYKTHSLDLTCKPDGSGGLYIDGKFLKAHVTETYRSGASWYRVWSDGWIEQGGNFGAANSGWAETTLTFLKKFSDTNFSLFCQGNWSDAASSSCKITARSVSGATIIHANNLWSVQPSKWYACGY